MAANQTIRPLCRDRTIRTQMIIFSLPDRLRPAFTGVQAPAPDRGQE